MPRWLSSRVSPVKIKGRGPRTQGHCIPYLQGGPIKGLMTMQFLQTARMETQPGLLNPLILWPPTPSVIQYSHSRDSAPEMCKRKGYVPSLSPSPEDLTSGELGWGGVRPRKTVEGAELVPRQQWRVRKGAEQREEKNLIKEVLLAARRKTPRSHIFPFPTIPLLEGLN